MKKIYMVAGLALALTLGLGTAAFARQNNNHHNGHQQMEHRGSAPQTTQQAPPSYYQHGGEHENVAENKTIHEKEVEGGYHVD